jgi:DNA-binding transcriptional LysR family regulator
MDFDQLEIFLEVARLSSFSRAAEKRFRTQPAISSQIRALEEEVGARLLDRSGGRVSLTVAGKLFFKYAEETLEQRKTIFTAIAETEHVPRGEIVVGANEGTCLHILPEVFAQFKRNYPDVAVNIKRSDYAKILESVSDNSVDFGVVSLPVRQSFAVLCPYIGTNWLSSRHPNILSPRSRGYGGRGCGSSSRGPKAGHTGRTRSAVL